MTKAVMGKILWVDLTAGECREENIPEKVYENFLSGLGLAAWLLYQRIPVGTDPLGPQNVLGFTSGLLTGSGSLMTGRWMVAAKSPLTGGWGDSNCGGSLAPAIKQCGYDGIFFSGVSPKPVYLLVEHDAARLLPADDLWGRDARETEQVLWSRSEGRQPAVACIGPAGERLSCIAGIVNDQGRLAARSGLGAVMGSKRLKALVLHGAHPILPADPAAMRSLTAGFERKIHFQPPFLSGKGMQMLGTLMRRVPLAMRQDGMLYKILITKWGTTSLNQFSIESGDAPIRNWAGSSADFPAAVSRAFDPDRIRAREQAKYHCYSCPVGCGGTCELHGGETHKPEYETVLALGGLLMIEDLDAVFEMNELLNRAGMDSISAGGTVAFAFECFERGLITPEMTGGLELRWGSAPAARWLIERMIAREGIGDLLADGSRQAGERIGQTADRYAVHAGGSEPAMHDGRNDPGFALHYVVEPTPGRHTLGSFQYYEMFQLWRKLKNVPPPSAKFYPKDDKYEPGPEQAAMAAACSRFSNVLNGAGVCLFGAFVGVHRMPVFEWLNAATGWQRTPEEYMKIGQNIQDVRQAFNACERLPLRADIHPRAVGRPPQKQGANRGRSVTLEVLVPLYWREMGWDTSTGAPAGSRLTDLGLESPHRSYWKGGQG